MSTTRRSILAEASISSSHNIRQLHAINEALVHRDIESLRRLARMPGGFLDDGVRRRAWLMLLNISHEGPLPAPMQFIDRSHTEYRQVELDVHRSFVHFPESM